MIDLFVLCEYWFLSETVETKKNTHTQKKIQKHGFNYGFFLRDYHSLIPEKVSQLLCDKSDDLKTLAKWRICSVSLY